MSTLAYNSQEPIVLHTREMVSSSSSFLFNKFEVCSFDLAYKTLPSPLLLAGSSSIMSPSSSAAAAVPGFFVAHENSRRNARP